MNVAYSLGLVGNATIGRFTTQTINNRSPCLPAGAISASQSNVYIYDGSNFVNNSAGFGGKRGRNNISNCADWVSRWIVIHRSEPKDTGRRIRQQRCLVSEDSYSVYSDMERCIDEIAQARHLNTGFDTYGLVGTRIRKRLSAVTFLCPSSK